VIVGEGTRARLSAATDGPLYLKLNDRPGSLADNGETLAVTLRSATAP
jgi:hypothetical protein